MARSVTVSRAAKDKAGHSVTFTKTFTVTDPAPATSDLTAVAVFPTYTTKTYGKHAAVLAKLQALGIKAMRHQLMPNMSTAVQQFTADAFAMGISSWVTVGTPRTPFTTAQWDACEALLKGPLRGKISRVFSWNEPNNQRSSSDPPTTNWDTLTVAEAKKLWAMMQRVNADYATDGTRRILVGTPGLWSGSIPQQYTDLGKIAAGLAGTYDFISWHLYMRPVDGTWDPALCVDEETRFRQILNDQTSQIVCTESGLFTAPNYTGGSNPVTEAQQATIIPQLVNWYVSRGYGFCYFELLDDPDSTGSLREASFGVVRCPAIDPNTWTLKPGFGAFRDAIAA